MKFNLATYKAGRAKSTINSKEKNEANRKIMEDLFDNHNKTKVALEVPFKGRITIIEKIRKLFGY